MYVTNWRRIFGIQVHVLHWRNFYWNSSINHIKRFFFDLKKNLWMLKNKRNDSFAIGKLYMYYTRRREFKNSVSRMIWLISKDLFCIIHVGENNQILTNQKVETPFLLVERDWFTHTNDAKEVLLYSLISVNLQILKFFW